MASISMFKSALATGGARANQFEMYITPPASIGFTWTPQAQDFILCKGASLPASSIADVPVQYRGKTVHFAGERTYAPWTVTFFNTLDETTPALALRNFFEEWQTYIQSYSNISGSVLHDTYTATIDVNQLDRLDNIAHSYKFINAFPTEISEIALAYETENAIEEFTVTFTYDYFVSTATSSTETDAATVETNTTAMITG
jgi:hypothetical protein